jgi:hypothetical protein
MANLGKDSCIVREIQAGICREEDIARYMDAYGRGTADDPRAASSLAVYQQILTELKKKA